jgi:hypothetical protein
VVFLRSAIVILSAASLLLSACTNQSLIQGPKGSAGADTARFEPIRDIPIPTGSTLDNDRSLILSNEKEWTGRLVMKSDPAMPQLFAYYAKQMPGFGWEPVASIMGETSVLTYVQGARAATVQIKPGTLTGSVVTVTMAPRHATAPGGMQTGVQTGLQGGVRDSSIQTDTLAPIGTPAR